MFALLVVLAVVGVVPLVSLASHTSRRTWILAGVAFVLGAALAAWVYDRLIGKPAAGMPSLLPIWVVAVVALAFVVRGTSNGTRLIYSAAVEGFVCATVFYGVRAFRRDRTINRKNRKE